MVILGIAAALRFVDLPGRPGGLFEDEAAEGWDATRIGPHLHPILFDDDGGREGLFAYLVALAFRVAGTSVGTLRGVSAALGVLAVLAIFLAVRRFGAVVALTAAAWAAGSLWLVAVSRDGFRNMLVPLVGAIALGALLHWARRPGRMSAAIAGAACGLGLWTYQPLKLLPLLVALWMLRLWRARSPVWPALRAGLGWLAAGYLLVAGPMLVTAVLDPSGFFSRGAGVSAFNPEYGGASGLPLHVLRTIAAFGAAGDPNPRHDAADLPLLSLPLTLVAVAGGWRAWRRRADPGHALLLIGIPVFLLPALIALEGGSPHFLRLLGLAPYLAALIGLGVVEVAEMGGRLGRAWGARLAAGAALATLLAASAQGAHAYFSRPAADLYAPYSNDLVALAGAATADSTVILDSYRQVVVQFLDRDHLPRIVAPGTRLAPGAGPVLATSRDDLVGALGADAAAGARVVARDPQGQPVVFEAAP